MESPDSETVAVMPDMSEPMTSDPEETTTTIVTVAAAGERKQPQQSTAATTTAATATVVRAMPQAVQATNAHPVAVAANVTSVSSAVPVSLPVGSIIGVANSTGTTFNVITSDQLQLQGGQFKQMLCVDNGFICESNDKNDPLRWNGELKATHIVIQNSPDDNDGEQVHVTTAAVGGNNQQMCSWSECAAMDVLPVRCKNTNAELHKNRFGSGGRGRCIKLGNDWYTPSEFEALCGRASSKDWKRSIRFGGRSLQTLIDEQILRPHATSCTCSACCDDDSAAGPIRLFTPYKRRRRAARDPIDIENPSRRHKGESSRDGSNNDDSETELITDKNCWPTFVSAEDIVVQHPQETPQIVHNVNVQQPTENGHVDSKFQKLDDVAGKLLKVAYEFKRVIEELKQEDSRQQRRDQNLVAQLDTRTEVIETVGLQPASDSHSKKCANCNRDAFAECSLCRRTPYCSTFCQRKDWNVHQVECVRDAAETVMLIVESSGEATALPVQTTDQ